ncbi:Rhodanese-like domain-containing protein 7 [Camellia lanceoleosa]|uniref:Rhodanese-like domain-containing protein 7 n=1 Tax=Camellia lanceoleosa TaxID=1840588 RepID=A0ACC0H5G2_9ERIC|nr:Rhodanese-like domain-containing protein 7 [Camellia lanceoleosa]
MLRCRASFSSFRMLSSSSNPNPSFLCITTPTSTSSLSPQFPNPNISLSNSNPHVSPRPPQSMSPSKCFSATSNPITVSKTSESTSADFEAIESSSQPLVVVSFYKFADFPRHADMRKPLKDLCELLRVSGGIILAPEGINGSICGIRESVEKVLQFIQTDKRLKGLRQVESPVSPEEEAIHHGHSSSSPLAAGEDAPFRWDHVRVKLKKEIVSLGMPTVSPVERVGKYVNPKDWNSLIGDPDTVVIDVRNDYETRIGRFKGAVDPRTTAFRKFPSWVDDQFQLAEPEAQVELDHSDGSTEHNIENQGQKIPPRVAMYCTGGIRCEKASSFLLSKGFKEVYHLEGGILKYLEEVPKTESLWEGECFVFDKRVSVDHGLVQGTFKLCYGCKQPVSDADMEAPEWEYGVSCPHCYSSKSEEEKERARARQRQFETWGIIGGPDKGRPPARTIDGIQGVNQVSKSL